MFGPKFASALSKALAARTSADFSAVAATVAAVAAIGVAHENRHSNSNEQQQSHRQNVPKEEHRREASFKSTAASLPSLPQTQCQQFANVPPQHHFSRLARRRTIEKVG